MVAVKRRLLWLVVGTAALAGVAWALRRRFTRSDDQDRLVPAAVPWPPLPDDRDEPAPAAVAVQGEPGGAKEPSTSPVTAEIPAVRVAPPTPAQRRGPRKEKA